jgi:hypothetical protein
VAGPPDDGEHEPGRGRARTCQDQRSAFVVSRFESRSPPDQGSVILPALDSDALLARLRRLEIETPSWGYGNSGTRFPSSVAGRARADP